MMNCPDLENLPDDLTPILAARRNANTYKMRVDLAASGDQLFFLTENLASLRAGAVLVYETL